MLRDITKVLATLSTASALAGCVAAQTGENTVEMADEISNVRHVQVMRNLALAISDHDMVPSQIVLATGQANASTGVAPTFKLPHFDFSKATKELDFGATVTWSAQWQFTAVTDAGDLRTLRDIYVLIASTDQQYDQLQQFFINYPEYRTRPIMREDNKGVADPTKRTFGLDSLLQNDLPPETARTTAPVPAPPMPNSPWAPSHVVTWKEASDIIIHGDSIGCMRFQNYELDGDVKIPPRRSGIPFRRWLFWRKDGGAWEPNAPDREVKSLGHFDGWEIGITSPACFDDFVILVQGATPAANAASTGSPKPSLAPAGS